MDYFTTSTKQKKTKQPKNPNNPNRPTGSVRLSTDPQSVAARERRHRISDRFKILQSLVPGGSKMDTVSMLEQAINYVKFLKTQIVLHETLMNQPPPPYSEDETSSFMFTDDQVAMLPDMVSAGGNYNNAPEGCSGLYEMVGGGCSSQMMMYPPAECFPDDGGMRYM